MLETVCTRGGSSVGVILASPHKEMTPRHMVRIPTVYCTVYVAFLLHGAYPNPGSEDGGVLQILKPLGHTCDFGLYKPDLMRF